MKGFSLSLSDTEMWMLLPVCASLLMAVVGYFLLNAAVDETSKVTDEERAAFKKEVSDLGAEVRRKAQEKVERDQQLIAARIERERLASAADATSTSGDSSTSPAVQSAALRRRRVANKEVRTTASDSSDNDWELVDNDDDETTAEESDVGLPAHYQAATDAFVEAIHHDGNSQPHAFAVYSTSSPRCHFNRRSPCLAVRSSVILSCVFAPPGRAGLQLRRAVAGG